MDHNSNTSINPLLLHGLCSSSNIMSKISHDNDRHADDAHGDELIAACFEYASDENASDKNDVDDDEYPNGQVRARRHFGEVFSNQYVATSMGVTPKGGAPSRGEELEMHGENGVENARDREANCCDIKKSVGLSSGAYKEVIGHCGVWASIVDMTNTSKPMVGNECEIGEIPPPNNHHCHHQNSTACYNGISSMYDGLPSPSTSVKSVDTKHFQDPSNPLFYTSNTPVGLINVVALPSPTPCESTKLGSSLDSVRVSFRSGSLPHSTQDDKFANDGELLASTHDAVTIQGEGHMNVIPNNGHISLYSHCMLGQEVNDADNGYYLAPVCSGGSHDTSAEVSVKELSNSASRGKTHIDEAQCTQSKLDGDGDSGEVSQPRKRSRVAENHNLSEKRRRNRINEKLRSMQALIPNSTKTDKASILDEAIEYLKSLQSQLQIMSSRNSMRMSPVMNMPSAIQHHVETLNQGAPRHNPSVGHVPMSMRDGVALPSFEHAPGPNNMPGPRTNSSQAHVNNATAMASSSRFLGYPP